jgi:hypothetical protein
MLKSACLRHPNGFVKTGDGFQKINYPGAIATFAFHINDKGQVAGWYEDKSQVGHGGDAARKLTNNVNFRVL